jgi:hypothetical protein
MPLSPNGAPPGYYYQAGATAYLVDPAGTYSVGAATAPTTDPVGAYSGPGASAPTLAAAGAYIPIAGATSAASEIVCPAGTYSPAGSSAPIADPGGAYSAAGASAPTTDPAGTYSSPYALDRLILDTSNATPSNMVLSFSSATAVENYYGSTSTEATIAIEFFAGYSNTTATLMFARYTGGGNRPHLYGANLSTLTLNQLQSISGSLSITFQGLAYSGSINLSGVQSFSAAATAIQTALDSNLPVEAVTAGTSIAPVSVSFTGSVNGSVLQVTSVSSGSIELGAEISGTGITSAIQIVRQITGTPGGVGLYILYRGAGSISSETITESYGVLTVGSVTSGTVAVGQEVKGAGVLPLTAIDSNLSGNGPASTWLVNNAQTVAGENMTLTATPLTVEPVSAVGATGNNDFFMIQPNGNFGYDLNPSSLSFMSGTAASSLGLTQASGAIDSTRGGLTTSAAEYMNNVVQNESGQFGSFEGTWTTLADEDPEYQGNLEAWAQSTDGLYTFLSQTATTPPAGSSTPTTDPAGTYSGAGVSAPTPAAAGTYLPGTGATSAAAEIVDPAGTYSLAGASAPTTDPVGTYSGAGASAPTPADPGTYIPFTGATSAAVEIADPAGAYSLAGASAPTIDSAGTYSAAHASAATIDPAGSYSLAGASAPTLAQPGYYVPTAGASSEIADDSGYYTPLAGSTAEYLPPAISGTAAGRSTASGQPDTPFALGII